MKKLFIGITIIFMLNIGCGEMIKIDPPEDLIALEYVPFNEKEQTVSPHIKVEAKSGNFVVIKNSDTGKLLLQSTLPACLESFANGGNDYAIDLYKDDSLLAAQEKSITVNDPALSEPLGQWLIVVFPPNLVIDRLTGNSNESVIIPPSNMQNLLLVHKIEWFNFPEEAVETTLQYIVSYPGYRNNLVVQEQYTREVNLVIKQETSIVFQVDFADSPAYNYSHIIIQIGWKFANTQKTDMAYRFSLPANKFISNFLFKENG